MIQAPPFEDAMICTILKSCDDNPHALKVGRRAVVRPCTDKGWEGALIATQVGGARDLVWPEECSPRPDGSR